MEGGNGAAPLSAGSKPAVLLLNEPPIKTGGPGGNWTLVQEQLQSRISML